MNEEPAAEAGVHAPRLDRAGALTVVMLSLLVFLALIATALAGGDAGKVDIAD